MKFLKKFQNVLTAFWQCLWDDHGFDDDSFVDFVSDKKKQIKWQKEKYKK